MIIEKPIESPVFLDNPEILEIRIAFKQTDSSVPLDRCMWELLPINFMPLSINYKGEKKAPLCEFFDNVFVNIIFIKEGKKVSVGYCQHTNFLGEDKYAWWVSKYGY
jgi:hypothetical protein